MCVDTNAEYELALQEGDEYSAELAARLRSMIFTIDCDTEDMTVEEPDF